MINPANCEEKASSPKLNNSIRKKLFDPDELSTSSTKNTGDDSFMSPRLRQLQKNFFKNNDSEPRLEMARAPVADMSLNDDNWEDSFEFENQAPNPNDKNHRSSSPKKNKNRKILCDIGSENDQDDSVFLAEHKNIELSPVGNQQTPKKLADLSNDNKMDLSILSNSLFSKNLQHQHHNRIFHFDTESDKNEAIIKSPNLSPISQKKSDLNSSTESQKSQHQKSIIFMDFSKSSEKPRQNVNKSFSIENQSDSMSNHYKREEIYNQLYHDTYENLIKKTEMQSRDVNRTILLQNSTTTTINQSSSQDTGYQTNCFGQNGTNNSSNVTNASEMMLFKKPSSLSLPVNNTNKIKLDKQEISPERLKSSFDFKSMGKNLSKSCDKTECKQRCRRKKFSLSLNSFERMQPIECSTPEKLKSELKSDLFKSKTTIDFRSVVDEDENTSVFKVYDCSSRNNLDCSLESDETESYQVKKEKIALNCSYMEQSMLNGKSASDYARSIIDKAKQELIATSYYFNSKNTNRTNRV